MAKGPIRREESKDIKIRRKSQSNKRSRNNSLRSMVRKEAGPISSPNPWKHGVCPRSKGKAYEARYAFAQGNSGRLWRHEPVQGMGSDKERRCGFKGRGIHRREASQPNASGLRGRTENRSRVDHGLARTTRRAVQQLPTPPAIESTSGSVSGSAIGGPISGPTSGSAIGGPTSGSVSGSAIDGPTSGSTRTSERPIYKEIVVQPLPKQGRQRSSSPEGSDDEESDEEQEDKTVKSTAPIPRISQRSTKGIEPQRFSNEQFDQGKTYC